MRHSQLIKIAQLLGYNSITDGLCKGFSAMWTQAVCCGDLDRFYHRLVILEQYADKPEELKVHIERIRGFVKQGQKLTDSENDIQEIQAFFEGIAFYLDPEIGYEMVGQKKLHQYNEEELSKYIQSEALEALGGLKRAFHTTDQYNQKQLTDYLNIISNKLNNNPNVAINLSANGHSVAVRVVGPDQFELVDTNHLNEVNKRFTSKELAVKLNSSFVNTSWLDWFKSPKPLVMYTSIFISNNSPLTLEELRTTGPLSELSIDNQGRSMLQIAASKNDVEALKRINFEEVNINPALGLAALLNNHETAYYLLSLPDSAGLDTNLPTVEPVIFRAIALRNYEIAREISKHSSFDPSKSNKLGNALHHLAMTKNSTADIISFAQELINLKNKNKMDINQKNSLGSTPLELACRHGNLELAKLFLTNGAKVSKVLHEAVLSGNLALMFEHSFSPIQSPTDSKTPLHYACQWGKKEIVEGLLANGADCQVRSKEGLTPLDLACKYHPQLIPSLLEKTTLSRDDFKPNTPLMNFMSECKDSALQRAFLIKAITAYIGEHENRPQYWWNWGLVPGTHTDEKIGAAKALLNTFEDIKVDLAPHQAALNDGLLSYLYKLSKEHYPHQSSSDSYGKMCGRMNITTLPQQPLIANSSAPPQKSDQSDGNLALPARDNNKIEKEEPRITYGL